MVRLLGKIAEKQILPTHDTILKHGTAYSATATEQNASLAVNTGFNSVKKIWGHYLMKSPSPTGLMPFIDGDKTKATYGATALLKVYTCHQGALGYTLEWFAIGD